MCVQRGHPALPCANQNAAAAAVVAAAGVRKKSRSEPQIVWARKPWGVTRRLIDGSKWHCLYFIKPDVRVEVRTLCVCELRMEKKSITAFVWIYCVFVSAANCCMLFAQSV